MMFTKRYSKALLLLGALLFAGCGEKAAAVPQYDLPSLLFSDFDKAQVILGKPRADDVIKANSGPERYVIWGEPKEWNLHIVYRTEGKKMPLLLLFGFLRTKHTMDKATFLKNYNLKADETRYKMKLVPNDQDSSKIQGVLIELPDAYTKN